MISSSLLLSDYTNDADPSKYAGVVQGTYGITSANSERPILFTTHVKNCVTVTLYDKERKVGMLLHIDAANSKPKIIEKIKKNFLRIGSTLDNLEASIIGGYNASEAFSIPCIQMRDEIKKLTSCLTEHLFKKQPLSSEKKDEMNSLYQKFEKAESKDQESLMSQIDAIRSSSFYSQIALDTRTGKVLYSSKIKYLYHNVKKHKVYSQKAFIEYSYLNCILDDKMSSEQLQAMLGITKLDVVQKMFESFALATRPFAKVYDSTQPDKKYF